MRMGHLLLGTVLMLGFLYAAPQAKADDILCYDYEETTVYCGGNQYCDTYTQGRCLLGGCSGNFCGTNYGFCCNRQYPSKFVSGTCRPLPDYCGESGASNKTLIPRQRETYARISSPVPQRLVFLPDRCGNTYALFDPESYSAAVRMPAVAEQDKAEVYKR